MNFRSKEMYIHSLMCIIGGFFGAYAIVNGFENMGSAQTTNMIDIVCTLLGKNYFDFFLRNFSFCALHYGNRNLRLLREKD